ncbi:MAG: hypothetical protein RL308_1101 [Bacteroidota bacterium]|jgi:hypothetical protein
MKSTITFVIFIFFLSVFGFTQNCDNIILHSGLEISSVVEEIRLNEIAYRKCDNPTGPLYVILKSEVFLIKYKNGTSQVIEKTASTETTNYNYTPKEKKLRVNYGFDLFSSIGKGNGVYNNYYDTIYYERGIKYSYGLSSFCDISIGKKSFLGLNLGIEHFPKSLGIFDYAKTYIPILLEYKFFSGQSTHNFGFSFGLGYSYTSNKIKHATYPEPVESYNYITQQFSYSNGGNVMVNVSSVFNGITILPRFIYAYKLSDNLFLNCSVGMKMQSFSIEPVYNSNFIYSDYFIRDNSIFSALQFSIGLTRLHLIK